jgi:hypothetical protein
MMRTSAALVSAALIGVSFTACSGSGGGSSVSAAQAASDVASALCTRIQACTPFLIQVAYGDLATCTSRTTATPTATLAAPGTGWVSSAAEECAQAIPGVSCDDALGNALPAACRPPAGQLALGAACGDSAQCASAYCNLGAGGKCGTCAAALGATGSACFRDGDCAIGTVCNGSDLTKKPEVAGQCAALGAAGAACDGARPCLKTLACSAGACATPGATSASCTQTGSDFFGSCDELTGDYCSKATGGACTTISLATAGGACGTINNALTSCSGSGTCPPTGASATCVAPAADFGNCDPVNGPSCLSPAQCIGGVCTLPTPASCK